MIINSKQIENATVKITCGEEQGTGFFVTENTILTARHVIIHKIEENKPILVGLIVKGELSQIAGELIDHGGEDLDIALIKLKEKVTEILPCINSRIRYNSEWESFGYPHSHINTGEVFQGSVKKINKLTPYDIELNCYGFDNSTDYSGLSGSSLVIAGKVAGIMTWSIVTGFGALSMNKASHFLDSNEIPYELEKNFNDIPDELLQDIKENIPNYESLDELESKMSEGGKYYLLHGSPGSGKTAIVAQLQLQSNEILGKYFIRTPNDPRALTQRISTENFMSWLEDLISERITGMPYPKTKSSFQERVKTLNLMLNELNSIMISDGKIGFIALDGLDDVENEKEGELNNFLGVFSDNIPSNISILLSIAREEIIPVSIKSHIEVKNKTFVLPLSDETSEQFVTNYLNTHEIELSYDEVSSIASKAEGHPLYLNYLLESIRLNQPQIIGEWLTGLPQIEGDIYHYYEQIWNSDIKLDSDKVWISVTTSQIRTPVKRSIFLQIIPENTAYEFESKFSSLAHLYKNSDKLECYHSSFNLFVESKAENYLKQSNDNIHKFCVSNPLEVYSVTNRVYHATQSTNPIIAIDECNQSWTDDCALISVEPDLVLNDIKKVEELCIDFGKTIELLRIKLLQERIGFRYNSVLALNTYHIVDTLIALGKQNEAIRYLIRGQLLLVNNDHALFFLQKLYESGAMHEAELLLNAIRRRFKYLFSEQLKTSSIEGETFLLDLKSTTLYLNDDFEESQRRFGNSMMKLKRLGEDHLDNEILVKGLREHASSWNMAYIIWKFNRYPGVDKIKELTNIELSSEWTRHISSTVVYFEQFKDASNSIEKRTEFDNLIRDIEFLIDNYSYEANDEFLLIHSLYEHSKRSDIVCELIDKYLVNANPLNLRMENGVDPNDRSIHDYIDNEIFKGYLDSEYNYPIVSEYDSENWEIFLSSILTKACYLIGKGYRLKADSAPEKFKVIENEVDSILDNLNFSLAERVTWERSYALPEYLIPNLYYRILLFYIEFSPEKVTFFTDELLLRSKDQCGVFTEGYRHCLSTVADLLSKYELHKISAFKILKCLEEHTLLAVQNRWERTPLLLSISELYARLGNRDKGIEIYKEMLTTSMGPSWYKEDQFAIINTVLSLPLVKKLPINYFKDFAGVLESASGEMTFQRYVRSEKHSFINSLVKADHLDKALEYYKFEVLPDLDLIISNAESSKVDAPKEGDGYVLGANSIIEAASVCELLSNVKSNPLIIWAISEIFVFNSDIYRYVNSFAEIQSNSIESLEEEQLNTILDRLVILISSESMIKNRHDYLSELETHLPIEYSKLLQAKLTKVGIEFNLKEYENVVESEQKETNTSKISDDRYDDLGFPGMGKGFYGLNSNLSESIKAAQDELLMENPEKARKLIISGLEDLHNSESDIWMGGNLSSELGEVFNLLPSLGDSVDIIKSMKEFILNAYAQDWRVVNRLIKTLSNHLSENETNDLLTVIEEHISNIIAFQHDREGLFDWMDNARTEDDNDIHLIRFIVWLMNHPHLMIKKRAINALIWLGNEIPKSTIPVLLEEILSSESKISEELSAFVFSIIAKNNPKEVWKIIKSKSALQDDLCKIDHFMKKVYVINSIDEMRDVDSNSKAFFELIMKTISEEELNSGDVIFDESFLTPVIGIIEDLSANEFIDGKFCKSVIKSYEQKITEISLRDRIRADHYIARSFHEDTFAIGNYEYMLRDIINRAIIPCISQSNYQEIRTILEIPFIYEHENNG